VRSPCGFGPSWMKPNWICFLACPLLLGLLVGFGIEMDVGHGLGLEHDLGLGVVPSYKPSWDHISPTPLTWFPCSNRDCLS